MFYYLWGWLFLAPQCLESLWGRPEAWDDWRTGGWDDVGSPSSTCRAPGWLGNQNCWVVWLPHSMLSPVLADFLPGGSGLRVQGFQTPRQKLNRLFDQASWVNQTISFGWSRKSSRVKGKGHRPHRLIGGRSKGHLMGGGLWELIRNLMHFQTWNWDLAVLNLKHQSLCV